MTTLEEIIQQQQDLIEQYRNLVTSHKDAQIKLYKYIAEIHKLLLTGDPNANEIAIEHLGKLAEKANS